MTAQALSGLGLRVMWDGYGIRDFTRRCAQLTHVSKTHLHFLFIRVKDALSRNPTGCTQSSL